MAEKAQSEPDEEGEAQETATPEKPVVEKLAQAGPSSNPDARPKKKRKVDDSRSSDPQVLVEDVSTAEASASRSLARKPAPTISDALPSFPAPRRPDAPSKKALALQGLDKSLAGAELIDPGTVLPIAEEGEDNDGTGLSHRMRKRLRELGIIELFAGASTLGIQ